VTQKSRRRKAAQRVRRLSSQKENAVNSTYSFYHKVRIVEVVAPSLRDAQEQFQERYGYHPGDTVQERLK
jgi:hypothetical protein